MPALAPREIIRLRYNRDIPAFVRAAIRNNLNKEQVLIYLEIGAITVNETPRAIRRSVYAAHNPWLPKGISK